LDPLVKGVLNAVAEQLFHSTLTIKNTSEATTSNGIHEVKWLITANSATSQTLHLTAVGKPRPNKAKISFLDFHAAIASSCRALRCGKGGSKSSRLARSNLTALNTVLSEKSAAVNLILDGVPFRDASPEQRLQLAACLLRGVPAGKVAAEWTNEERLNKVATFWDPASTLDLYYTWSVDLLDRSKADGSHTFKQPVRVRFLSHSWGEPVGWNGLMGEKADYAQIKATEICGVAKDLAIKHFDDVARWADVQFWLDKCCIPQGHLELKAYCVTMLEEFIQLSDGLVVLVTWSYFERLWCVYEWVCFLMFHDPDKITLCASGLIRRSTLPVLLEVLQTFSLSSCKCYNESDRQVFYHKVDRYYSSREAFESFLRFSAIALICKDLACRQTAYGAAVVKPWADLATTCGFGELASHLHQLGDVMVTLRHTCAISNGQSQFDLQTLISQKVDRWFGQNIYPLVRRMRDQVSKEAARERLCSATAPPHSLR